MPHKWLKLPSGNYLNMALAERVNVRHVTTDSETDEPITPYTRIFIEYTQSAATFDTRYSDGDKDVAVILAWLDPWNEPPS